MKKSSILFTILIVWLFIKTNVVAQIGVQISIAPPVIPVYDQPMCPGDGYIWTPGYWAYTDGDYYWVPGVWVLAPQPGFLWTPGYWGFVGGYYVWNVGYWGPHIGYYGGVCYGHGYEGVGYSGGRWEGGAFRYNTAVSNVNVTVVHNTYVDRSEIHPASGNRASFNGPGGVEAKPTENERAAMNENHIRPSAEQQLHEQAASKDKSQFASVNKGKPAITGISKVGSISESRTETQKTAKSAPAKNNQGIQQHNATQQQRSTTATQQHNNTPKQNNNAGVVQQHNTPQQRSAPVQQHSAPVQQHNIPVRENAPKQNNEPMAQQHSAPQQQVHQAPQSQPHMAPSRPMGGGGGGGGRRK